MSFSRDAPWPTAAQTASMTESINSNYFPSLDNSTLTPNLSSTYGPSSSFHVVSGSELPSHDGRHSLNLSTENSPIPLSPGSAYPRSRKSTNVGMGLDASSIPHTLSGSIPLTASSKIVVSHTPLSVKPAEVWREILKTSYGRDKSFKIIQYAMRILLLAHNKSLRYFKRPRGGELVRRLNLTVAHLSLTRKCLILGNWLTPLIHITTSSDSSVPYASSVATLASPTLLHRFLHAPPPVLLDLFNAIADDISTLWKLGLVGQAIGQRASRLADWFWFASTLAGLVEVGAERAMVKGMLSELEIRIYDAEMDKTTDLARIDEHEQELAKLKSQYGWLQISRLKLVMDLIFVSYDLFKLKRGQDSMKSLSGMAAALLSSYKMYDSQRRDILKST